MEKSSFLFPPGVRFHPSDEELIVYYLLNKLNSRPLPAAVVGEIELYTHNPWELPKKALFGEDEWYFFSPRERKYPNGARPNRSAGSGYWKATGTDKVITSSSSGARIGVKKGLVFYVGKPPNGIKTEWIMIEYRIPDTLIRPQKSKSSMRLDHWVLCRIKQKRNMSNNMWENYHNTPHNPNKPTSNIPNMNDLPLVSSNYCPKFAGANDQNPTRVTSSTRTTSQISSNIGRLYDATTYEHDTSMDSSRMTESSYNNFSSGNPNFNNEDGYGDLARYNNNITNDVVVAMPHPSNNTSFYDEHESRGIFNLNLSGAMGSLRGIDDTF